MTKNKKQPVTRKFPKEFLRDIIWEEESEFEDKVGIQVKNEITDTGRWSVYHELVFSYDEKFYAVNYSVGATEIQDERPFEYEGDEVECFEVAPKPVTVIEYHAVYTDVSENNAVQGHSPVPQHGHLQAPAGE